jgi:hypothetical protein
MFLLARAQMASLFGFVDLLALFVAGLYAGTHVSSCLVLHPVGWSLTADQRVKYFKVCS